MGESIPNFFWSLPQSYCFPVFSRFDFTMNNTIDSVGDFVNMRAVNRVYTQILGRNTKFLPGSIISYFFRYFWNYEFLTPNIHQLG